MAVLLCGARRVQPPDRGLVMDSKAGATLVVAKRHLALEPDSSKITYKEFGFNKSNGCLAAEECLIEDCWGRARPKRYGSPKIGEPTDLVVLEFGWLMERRALKRHRTVKLGLG